MVENLVCACFTLLFTTICFGVLFFQARKTSLIAVKVIEKQADLVAALKAEIKAKDEAYAAQKDLVKEQKAYINALEVQAEAQKKVLAHYEGQ